MGLSPVYYALTDDFIAIGATSRDVRSILPKTISADSNMLADFIAGHFRDTEATFFEPIKRLPPATYLTLSPNQVNKRQYWDLSNVPLQKTIQSPVDTFRRLFDSSVHNLNVPQKTGVMLSGGQDSSAITASLSTKIVSPHTLPCHSMTSVSYTHLTLPTILLV